MAACTEKPKVLVLGGTGFIGRNFVQFLIKNDLASKIRVCDKVPPQMAWMNASHKECFANPLVEFKHANLISASSMAGVFTTAGGEFDLVINLAAETKYGQSDKVYSEGIVKLSLNCAREAAKRDVGFYIEMSSGQMSTSDKKAMREDMKAEPWTNLANHKLEVEKELQNIPGLKYSIIRPAIVYGLGDRHGLAPRLIIGAIYKYIQQKMKMLWTKQLRMNTVHVEDVCRAMWHVLLLGQSGHVYNVVDKGETTQGMISDLVAQVFGIPYEFLGSVKSNLVRVNMSGVVEDINDKHMAPWAEACTKDGITNTPLNPFIDQELLYNKPVYLDGSKLEETGFTYDTPSLQVTHLQQILDDYSKIHLFPQCLLSGKTTLSDQLPDLDISDDLPPLEDLNIANGNDS
ncbi:uncharacterized protein LOC128219954 [Mya arenaria]|uniref:uncharacterized protein LOC128219954 n=1 Tax=Mya arenaria TaxID=6604 RepID=UPI0022E7EA34|nr:uncharacterized protein LOC128219954 [Mya arenaria]